MALILILSFVLLLSVLTLLEIRDSHTAMQSANDKSTLKRLERIVPVMNSIKPDEAERFLASVSSCHDGYSLSDSPYPATNDVYYEHDMLKRRISESVALPIDNIFIANTILTKEQFSYSDCEESEIEFPLEGIVISIKLTSGSWLNMEIHPHEWHFGPSFHTWLVRSSFAFVVIGFIALFFLHRVSAPLRALTRSTSKFDGKHIAPAIDEKGPPDVKKAISAFNQMQSRVAKEMQNRLSLLAAISHDLRTPLTALRVKSELIDEIQIRTDIIKGLKKMESLISSALEFLRSGSMSEPRRKVSISSLVESECADLEDLGASITLQCDSNVECFCHPNALGRAVRNLIENAIKYASGVKVSVRATDQLLTISVSDTGPGINASERERAIRPFERLSPHRENLSNGFGLGLSIAKAVSEGHEGGLTLKTNSPAGLVASIEIPIDR